MRYTFYYFLSIYGEVQFSCSVGKPLHRQAPCLAQVMQLASSRTWHQIQCSSKIYALKHCIMPQRINNISILKLRNSVKNLAQDYQDQNFIYCISASVFYNYKTFRSQAVSVHISTLLLFNCYLLTVSQLNSFLAFLCISLFIYKNSVVKFLLYSVARNKGIISSKIQYFRRQHN